ncbi:MAG TPA: hypothetical protein VGP32_08745 [Steroidobacteraceae bacterium]|jgi:hypothetical protein|nr:hypothetical protein [Steroidobacteraceae bacterium]
MKSGHLVLAGVSITALLAACGGGGGGGGHGGGGGGGGGAGTTPATITSLSPTTVTAGGPTFTLTINGSNFAPGGTVNLNGGSIGTYHYLSASQVTILVPFMQIPGPSAATVDVQIPNAKKSNSLTLSVNSFNTSACVLFGPYDFFFTGFDANGPVTIAGSFGVDVNGNVTGEQDLKTSSTTSVAEPITDGTCVNSAIANEGTLTLTTADETTTYTFVTQTHPAPGVKGRVATSGGGFSGSGRFALAGGGFFSGDYVLGLVGNNSSGGRMSVLGRFTDTSPGLNASGTVSAGMGDINDDGTVSSQVTISGTIGAPDAYSRSAATLTVGAETLRLAIYLTGAAAGFVANADPSASAPRLAGVVNGQAGAGLFNNGNLDAPVVLSIWGASSGVSPASDTSVGIASGFNAQSGTFNLLLDQVAGGVASLDQTITGATYSIAANGRAVASYTSGGKAHSVILYLDDFNDGYILDTGPTVGYGFFEAQAAGPFSITSMQGGAFHAGTWFSPVAAAPNTVGQLSFNGDLSVSGATTGTYAVDPAGTGRGTAQLTAPLFGGSNVVFYIGSGSFVVMMGSDAVTTDAISFLNL